MKLVRQGVCKSFIEKENCRLSFFDNGFAVAYNDEAFLVIGVPSEIGADKAGDLLTRWMNASEEKVLFQQKVLTNYLKLREILKW